MEEAHSKAHKVATIESMKQQVAWALDMINRVMEQERLAKLEVEMARDELCRMKALLAVEREMLGEEREARVALMAQVEEHGCDVGRIRVEHAWLEVMAWEETRRRVEAEKEHDLVRKSTEEVLRRIRQVPGPAGVDGQLKGVLALAGAEMASLEVMQRQWENGVEGSGKLVRASSHKIIKLVKEELDCL
jgi:hypothetical protein